MIVFFLPDAVVSGSVLQRLGDALEAASAETPSGPPPAIPPGLGGEFFVLAERNAIYVEVLKLAGACVSRLNLDPKERSSVETTFQNHFYRRVMTNVPVSRGANAQVVCEALQTLTGTIAARPDTDAPASFYFEFFATAYPMLVAIASGDPKRLRPPSQSAPSQETPV